VTRRRSAAWSKTIWPGRASTTIAALGAGAGAVVGAGAGAVVGAGAGCGGADLPHALKEHAMMSVTVMRMPDRIR
jgi:hypothetical protein